MYDKYIPYSTKVQPETPKQPKFSRNGHTTASVNCEEVRQLAMAAVIGTVESYQARTPERSCGISTHRNAGKVGSMTGAPGEVYKLAAISGLIVSARSILDRSVIGCFGRPTTALNDSYQLKMGENEN